MFLNPPGVTPPDKVVPAGASSQDVSVLRLLRLRDVLKIVPVSRSAWYAGVRSGRFPKGRSFGPRVTVWRSDEIDSLVNAAR
jgi:prophage regulatory protein